MYKSVKNKKKKIAMTLTKKSDVKFRICMQKKAADVTNLLSSLSKE